MRKSILRKSILKAASAVMVMAAMLLVMPMTAKAETVITGVVTGGAPKRATAYDPAGRKNVVAKSGYLYTMPMQQEDGSVKELDLDFVENHFGLSEQEEAAIPAGYESKVVYIVYGTDALYGYTRGSYLGLEAPDGDNFVNERDEWDNLVIKFTINYNGKAYPNCRVSFKNDTDYIDGIGLYCILPQGYHGDVVYAMWGDKLVNGEIVQDENSWLQYYLSGDGASANQPAPELTEDTAPAPAPAPASGQTYTTKRGDNLMKIAKEWYGDQEKWRDIYEANKGLIKKPNMIFANMQLIMP